MCRHCVYIKQSGKYGRKGGEQESERAIYVYSYAHTHGHMLTLPILLVSGVFKAVEKLKSGYKINYLYHFLEGMMNKIELTFQCQITQYNMTVYIIFTLII